MKWLQRFAIAAVVIGVGAMFITGKLNTKNWPIIGSLNSQPAPPPAKDKSLPPPAVTVARVHTHTFNETLLVTGSFIARHEVLIAPQIDGQRIKELHADQGDLVRKGQLLARLETENLKAQVAQSEAAISSAQSAIEQAEKSIVEAEARASDAKAALDRAVKLRRSGYISQSAFDQREVAAISTSAQLDIARTTLAAARHQVSRAQARKRELTWRISRANISAPIGGLVMRRSAKIGAIASGNGEPMFHIIAGGTIELAGELASEDLARVRKGQTVRLNVPGLGTIDGKVRLVSPEVNPATRLGVVYIASNVQNGLKVGAFARADISVATSRGLAVPASAVLNAHRGAMVHVVESNRIKTKVITTGLRADGLIEVTKGLSDGEMVIARAGMFLRDGDEVRPVSDRTTSRLTKANQ